MHKYICFNKNENYKDEIEKIILDKKGELFEFFEEKSNTNLDCFIYIYETIDDLVKGMSNRGFERMPDYMCACFKDEDNSINLFEPKDNPSADEWTKEEYENVIFHELIHAICYKLYGKQPEWLTEGIAKYLDGSYKQGIKELFKNNIHNNEIPPMFELENEFGMHEYNSYDYAYLMICYLIETNGKDKFLNIVSNKALLDEYSNNLVFEAISYYNKKYF